MTKGMYSSESSEWETPKNLFDHYDSIFQFQLDVCASKNNKKVRQYISKNVDGLSCAWQHVNWMNPPYGREIGKWIKKAFDESLLGNTTVCLLPARTDTKWWQDYVMKADVIHFIRGRLKFGNMNNSAPFPSAIVIFGLYGGY